MSSLFRIWRWFDARVCQQRGNAWRGLDLVRTIGLGCLMGATSWAVPDAKAAPPFSGTIFVSSEIITENDPTTYIGMEDAGRGTRQMFDRRVNAWIQENAFLFAARFDDELTIEIQVNPEFESVDAAREVAERFAPVIGRLPTALRRDVETVWIHRGVQPFGGGNNNLLIHTGQADVYVGQGILEETLVHEAAHTSLDADHARSQGWLEAQRNDPDFISTYARDNPFREDVAESFLLYLAARPLRDRISDRLADTIESTIPHRLEYFDQQSLDLYPLVPNAGPRLLGFRRDSLGWRLTWEGGPREVYAIEISTTLDDWEQIGEPVESEAAQTTIVLDPEFLELQGREIFLRVRRVSGL